MQIVNKVHGLLQPWVMNTKPTFAQSPHINCVALLPEVDAVSSDIWPGLALTLWASKSG